jgi:hypothetical protein
MVVIGPGLVTMGLSPNTALCGFGDFGYLGPVVQQTIVVDPVSKLFLLVGKILAIRRVLENESITAQGIDFSTNLQNAQMAMIQQEAGDGAAGFNAYEVVWQTQSNAVNNLTIQFDKMVSDADNAVRNVFQRETAVLISVDPNADLDVKVSSVIRYMQDRNLYVEDSDYGMRDYLMTILRDVDNIPAAFPATADDPDFPDAWITPIPVDPSAVSRTWNILW